MIYGYCRVSTAKQHIERQIRNILKTYPDAKIITEVYTGRKFQGRKEMDKLLKILIPGDTIVFDSVSRMSRNAEEGWLLYEELYNMGIHLVFLNEPHVNTDVYRTAVQAKLSLMLENLDKDMERITKILVDAVNDMILILAQRQVKLAFEQSEKEVTDLRTRTSQGLREAKAKGHTNGRRPGQAPITKKSIHAKAVILKHSTTFGGNLKNTDLEKLVGITHNTLQKYKQELLIELADSDVSEAQEKYAALSKELHEKSKKTSFTA